MKYYKHKKSGTIVKLNQPQNSDEWELCSQKENNYLDLKELRLNKKTEIDNLLSFKLKKGIAYKGNLFHCDDNSRNALLAKQLLLSKTERCYSWYSMDGNDIDFKTEDKFLDFIRYILQYREKLFSQGKKLKLKIAKLSKEDINSLSIEIK